MFVEPGQTPHDTHFIGISVPGQSCYKPQYLYLANQFMCHAGTDLIDKLNLSRCTEDTYLEVKQRREDWQIEDFVKDKLAFQASVTTMNLILKILELKFDDDEDVQEKKHAALKVFGEVIAREQLERYVRAFKSVS